MYSSKIVKPRNQIQTKLTIGQPGDKYEQEADAMADQVMRMPQSDAQINRKCEDCEEESLQMKPIMESITPIIQKQAEEEEEMIQMQPMEEEEEMLQAKSDRSQLSDTSSLSTSLNNSKGRGTGMSEQTNRLMSNSFGTDFSNVKIHTDSKRDSNESIIRCQGFYPWSGCIFQQGRIQPFQ